MPTLLKEGDVVVLPTMGFTKFEFESNEYFIGPENQVLAKITK
jgi:co-chaperonin GroES (HSP10)